MILIKVGESADRFAASKVSIMIDSDALLTLAGEIIHGDSECWRNLLIKHHGTHYIQSRCFRHVSYFDHTLANNIMDPSTEIVSKRKQCGTARIRRQRRHHSRPPPASSADPSSQPNKVPNSVTNRACPTVTRQSF